MDAEAPAWSKRDGQTFAFLLGDPYEIPHCSRCILLEAELDITFQRRQQGMDGYKATDSVVHFAGLRCREFTWIGPIELRWGRHDRARAELGAELDATRENSSVGP